MKIFSRISLYIFISLVFGVSAFAQETQTKVVDEVVAQVNDGVITLSRIKRETKMIVDTYVQEGKKREVAQKEVDEKQGELIASLINEELLIQKAKDLGLESEVEATINQRLKEIMDQNKMKTVEALYQEMEKSGINPQELKETWRKQATRDKVLQKELQSKLYWLPNGKELKDYFDKHKEKFTKPETISISEVFLAFAGRDEKAVREKAKQIVSQLKAGADFSKIAKENDPGVVTDGIGKAENLKVADLSEQLAKTLKGLKTGDISEPFEADQLGMVILKVDARELPSNESVFDENSVRLAMMSEKLPDEQKKFMTKLRQDAYIKISDSYRPIVNPILFADERKDKPGK